MNRKGLAILMRTRMRPSSTSDPTSKINLSSPFPSPNEIDSMASNNSSKSTNSFEEEDGRRGTSSRINDFELVKDLMQSAILLNKAEVLDPVLNDFSQGYYGLCYEDRRELLLVLAKDYDLDRVQVRQLMKQYLGLQLPSGEESRNSIEGEGMLSIFYRTERNLRQALKPKYDDLFDRLNTHSGGLKFLSVVRADILSILADENYASMRALDSYLKEKLITWLSPASLELHRITWDDPASLLEKIVAYEAVHPISSLLDLKRRLGVGRRCFGYLHPAIPGEPLIFIEVALLKDVARTIQEVLWDDPPIAEREATCALFYSISSTQPGLAGINLGKFLIKRVIHLVKGEMPHISTFATLSPIPGFMRWLLSKLASQAKLAEEAETTETSNAASVFQESILLPAEERELVDASGKLTAAGGNKGGGIEVLHELLNSRNYEWTKSDKLVSAVRPALMRLCARYLIHEKKRGKALDSVANFHLQNGAMIERLNWMADRSDKGLAQSGGIMVNYVYKLENIEENAQAYFNYGHINASVEMPIS